MKSIISWTHTHETTKIIFIRDTQIPQIADTHNKLKLAIINTYDTRKTLGQEIRKFISLTQD